MNTLGFPGINLLLLHNVSLVASKLSGIVGDKRLGYNQQERCPTAMPSVRIRRYIPTDFPALAQLAVHAGSSPETACGQPDVASTDEFHSDYGHRNLERESWVLEDDLGNVVGFVAAQERRGVFVVDGPIVAPSHRRQGYGRRLMLHIQQDALASGAHEVEVGVRSTNVAGAEFLASLGVTPSREIFVYEAHTRHSPDVTLASGYVLADLKPRHLLPFLMVMHECFPGYRLPSNPQRLFEPDRMKIVLVLDAESKMAGAVTAFFYPEDGHGYLYHLGVSEAHRGKGLAHALLKTATDWLWDTHHPRLIGVSTSDDLGARERLFIPLGFTLQYSLRYGRKTLFEANALNDVAT
ncbi:MAG: GNAT family N-acetyltransferase [Candidatus Sericytochromatia bacterium]|nr:GNAT family N-acetyltransferase [Candidatus Sericytochromatia bacterium]